MALAVAIVLSLALSIAVISFPVMTGLAVAGLVTLTALVRVRPERVGAFGLCIAVTLIVAVPASEFTGGFRLAISVAAVAVMGVAYCRSSVRRPLSRALWLVPAWLGILALGDMSGDGAIKWVTYSALALATLLLAGRAEVAPVMRWIVGLSLIQVFVAGLQVTAGVQLPWEQVTAISGNELLGGEWLRGPGTMGHPLPLTLLLVFAFAALLRDPEWLPRIARLSIYVALGCGVAFAGSRSGALLLAGLVLFAAGRKFSIMRGAFGAVVAGFAVALLATSRFFESDYVEKILASGSVYHRQGAIDAIGNLLNDQGTREVLLGNGLFGVPEAFRSGLLQGDGFNTVDNQLVTLLVTSGLIGVALFVVFSLRALRAGNSQMRWVLLSLLAMFQIFDVLLWSSSTVLFMIAAGFALSRQGQDTTRLSARRPAPHAARGRAVEPLGSR
jgi:hypothetical protein